MSGWLRKLFGKESNHDSPNTGIELSEQQKSGLRTELGRLNEKHRGVGDRVIRYVLTGEGAEVLDLLEGSKELGAALSLKVCKGWTDFKLPLLFTPPVQDPTFYVRLGKVYEAASRSDGRTLHLDDAGVPAWLEILLWEASNIAPTICVRREVWLSHDILEAALAIAGERVDSMLRALLFTLRNRPSTRCTLLKSIPGLPQAVQRHPGVVHEMLTHSSARLRVQAIETLTETQCSPVEFAATLVSIDSPKTVRDAAETWLMTAGEQLLPALRAMAESGTPRQRARAVNMLWRIGGGAERRFLEQRRANETAAALADKSQDVREAAADWLAGRGDRSAVEPLMVAVKKEKKDRVKAAMMKALEVLGSSVDELLDRPGLLKEAEKGLAKGVPAALDWFAFDHLPAVHWADDRQAVDRSILTWWIVHAHKLATPEPSPLLRRYATKLVADDAGALGRLVLEAWIAHDTVTPTEQQAQVQAAQMVQQLGRVQPNVLAQWTQQILKTPVGSAIEHKGVLAIAGAMAGDTAAPLVARYLKDWYGMRAAQCKALLQMLAWVDHRSASQLLLQTATRFRTPGIRKLAEECVREVAQRRGWSVEELADRTIPTAEIDDDGVLRLSYGPRCFEARLDDELKLTITTPDGKTVSNLPEPRAVDDESAAKEAKQRFSQARKQLKTVLQQQRERLYEAMCTQRRWRFDDWQTYLAQHPIVGHLCQRVVWTTSSNDDPTASMRAFRPLGDGTMSGPDDSAIAIAADASIGVAHPLLLPDDEVAAWTKHLADYQVGTLFDQFGRPPYRVPEQKSGETALSDFWGHVVEAFKLRGHATKLGYVRGQAEDGGWFYAYRRHFPSMGLTAELRFSGNSLPEENRKVALEAMHFESEEDGANLGSEVPLSRVPAVLVSECWNDLREIATEGPGFDPDWKRTVAR